MQVRQLHLTPEHYAVSAELRKWCEKKPNRCYIPEWLLKAWDIPVTHISAPPSLCLNLSGSRLALALATYP
jgi:hypothetical protein